MEAAGAVTTVASGGAEFSACFSLVVAIGTMDGFREPPDYVGHGGAARAVERVD